MAINVDHSGPLAGRTATLAFRGGQAQYLENRRREEAARQMELLKMQQQQQQFNQSLANQQYQADANRQQQVGMMVGGSALEQLAQQSRFKNQMELAGQQNQYQQARQQQEHQNLLERDDYRNENYRESIKYRQDLQTALDERRQGVAAGITDLSLPEVMATGADSHRVLSPDGMAFNQRISEQVQKIKQSASEGAPEEAIQGAYQKLQQQIEEAMSNPTGLYMKPGGEVVSVGGRKFLLDRSGKTTDLNQYSDEGFQEIKERLKAQPRPLGGGRLAVPVLDPRVPGGVREEVIEALNEDQIRHKQRLEESKMMTARIDGFDKLADRAWTMTQDMMGEDPIGGTDPQQARARQIEKAELFKKIYQGLRSEAGIAPGQGGGAGLGMDFGTQESKPDPTTVAFSGGQGQGHRAIASFFGVNDPEEQDQFLGGWPKWIGQNILPEGMDTPREVPNTPENPAPFTTPNRALDRGNFFSQNTAFADGTHDFRMYANAEKWTPEEEAVWLPRAIQHRDHIRQRYKNRPESLHNHPDDIKALNMLNKVIASKKGKTAAPSWTDHPLLKNRGL